MVSSPVFACHGLALHCVSMGRAATSGGYRTRSGKGAGLMRNVGFKLFFTHRLALLAGAESLRSIREGLLWLLPCLLVSALLLILGQCAQALGCLLYTSPSPRD